MGDLAARLLAHLDKVEQQAIAAGHGFGHMPLRAEHNAGWTRLDLADNVRPGYDRRFVKDNSPDHVVRLAQAHRDIVEQYQVAQRAYRQSRVAFDRHSQSMATGLACNEAQDRAGTLRSVVEALARGYGLQED